MQNTVNSKLVWPQYTTCLSPSMEVEDMRDQSQQIQNALLVYLVHLNSAMYILNNSGEMGIFYKEAAVGSSEGHGQGTLAWYDEEVLKRLNCQIHGVYLVRLSQVWWFSSRCDCQSFVLCNSHFAVQCSTKWNCMMHGITSCCPHETAMQKLRTTLCRGQYLRIKCWIFLWGHGIRFFADGENNISQKSKTGDCSFGVNVRNVQYTYKITYNL